MDYVLNHWPLIVVALGVIVLVQSSDITLTRI
jgi:hypothetical protein